jgi:hypothetical protein
MQFVEQRRRQPARLFDLVRRGFDRRTDPLRTGDHGSIAR